jgi:hypothetical protein
VSVGPAVAAWPTTSGPISRSAPGHAHALSAPARTVEAVPDPDRTAVRTGVAVLAAGGVATTMLLAGTSGITLVVTVLLAGVQALLLRGTGGARRAQRFLLAASAQAGLTYPVAGDATVASALVYLGVGVVFGLVVVVALGMLHRAGPFDDPYGDPAGEPRSGTRPLPVVEGD